MCIFLSMTHFKTNDVTRRGSSLFIIIPLLDPENNFTSYLLNLWNGAITASFCISLVTFQLSCLKLNGDNAPYRQRWPLNWNVDSETSRGNVNRPQSLVYSIVLHSGEEKQFTLRNLSHAIVEHAKVIWNWIYKKILFPEYGYTEMKSESRWRRSESLYFRRACAYFSLARHLWKLVRW